MEIWIDKNRIVEEAIGNGIHSCQARRLADGGIEIYNIGVDLESRAKVILTREDVDFIKDQESKGLL